MGNDYRNNEVEIDLVEMFFYVLKKWKVIVIWGIIGLILGCGFSYYKMVQMDPANLDAYFAKLEEKGADVINEDNITIYRDYKALYDGLLEYGKKSVVLNMNPNEVYSASANYYYSCEDIKSAESFFNSYLNTEAYEVLVEASGLECDTNDIKEMVEFWFSKTTESNLIVDSAYREEKQTGNLSISAFAPTKDALDGMMIQLKVLVESANKELKQNGGKFETYFLNENESFGYSNSVVSRQQEFINNRVSYLKNATEYMDKFSDDEKLYIAYYYPDEDTKLETRFSKKWPVIFAVALAFMIAAVYAVVFILNGKINCESDMSFVKNLYVIAFIEGKERKGLDKVFEKWARGNSPQNSSIEYTSDYLNKLGTKSIAICYNKDIELEKNVAAKVKEYCKEKVELVGCMTDSESIGKISNADEIVSIVCLGTTRKADLYRTLDVCKQFGKGANKLIVIR